MSGGVDSSVAAALLAEQGHDVIGLSMQLYDQTEGQTSFGSCCSIDDLHDARRVAAAIDIPHYILNFERQFDEQVVSNFVSEYAAGRTPLPCAHCNSDLKFATLAERARGFGADAVATGHYARVERDATTGRYLLRRGVDAGEGPVVLPVLADAGAAGARACFRSAICRRTRSATTRGGRGLPVADKPDSQEICFIPDHDYARVRRRSARRTRRATARSSTRAAACSARHGGIHRFTVGQRKGLGLLVAHRRAAVRAGAQAGRPAGGGRPEGVARADDADGVRRELDRRGAAGDAARRRADPPSPSGGAGRGAIARRRTRRGRSSTRRSSRSRPARRWCSTTATRWSAAGGSTDDRSSEVRRAQRSQ